VPELLFQKIGYETKIGKNRWAGPVIATSDALYCVLRTPNSTSHALAAHGGLLGALAGAIVGAATKCDSEPVVLGKAGDAPDFLRAPPTGPLRRCKPDVPMLIVERRSIDTLCKDSWINNVLCFAIGSTKVVVSHSLFSGRRVHEFLVNSGWPLRWRGQEFNKGIS
jgi:hypothetical protein